MVQPKRTLKKLKAAEQETRKPLIMDAAERVFAHKPHDRVSMREIAAEAIKKKTTTSPPDALTLKPSGFFSGGVMAATIRHNSQQTLRTDR